MSVLKRSVRRDQDREAAQRFGADSDYQLYHGAASEATPHLIDEWPE